MIGRVFIIGSASRIGLPGGWSIERAVHDVVEDALQSAEIISRDAIDIVVTVGSDIIDGSMIATRSGIAGSYGRELITVPSSGGHAFGAAVALIESGSAQTVLLAGWGEGTKFGAFDGRVIQADPFWARPVGADALALGALQAQRLQAGGRLSIIDAKNYADAMGSRARGPNGAPLASTAHWLMPNWVDGAAAIVLSASARGREAIVVRDFGSSFRPYCPEPEDFDPAQWVVSALGHMRDPSALVGLSLAAIEASAPTAFCEALALEALLPQTGWDVLDARVNSSGGGAVTHFGPATALRQLSFAVEAIRGPRSGDVAGAAVLDLAGPIGQATTVILLESGSAA